MKFCVPYETNVRDKFRSAHLSSYRRQSRTRRGFTRDVFRAPNNLASIDEGSICDRDLPKWISYPKTVLLGFFVEEYHQKRNWLPLLVYFFLMSNNLVLSRLNESVPILITYVTTIISVTRSPLLYNLWTCTDILIDRQRSINSP